MARASFSSLASTKARQMSTSASLPPGQWISHRSTWSVPSWSRLVRSVSS
jgi:hypothetical protein